MKGGALVFSVCGRERERGREKGEKKKKHIPVKITVISPMETHRRDRIAKRMRDIDEVVLDGDYGFSGGDFSVFLDIFFPGAKRRSERD